MKHLMWSILLTTILGSCARSGPGPPPIDLNEIAPIIADLQLAEALTGEVPVLVRDSMRDVYMLSILEEYGLSQEEFDSIMWIVRQEPIWIDSVYSRAGEIVSRMQVKKED